jgi:hypothetical protein
VANPSGLQRATDAHRAHTAAAHNTLAQSLILAVLLAGGWETLRFDATGLLLDRGTQRFYCGGLLLDCGSEFVECRFCLIDASSKASRLGGNMDIA